MNSKPHVIGKQVFEAEYNSTEDGLAFRSEFTDLVKQNLLTVIEEVLDELAPKDALLRLDKIEIDLGEIHYPFDAVSLKASLRTKLRNELNFKLVSIRHKSVHSSEEKETLLSVQKTEEEIILFFLEEGYLPWWVGEKEKLSVVQIINTIFNKNPKSIVELFGKIKSNPKQLSRLVFHSDKNVLFFIISHYAASPISVFENAEQIISKEIFGNYIHNVSIVFRTFLVRYFVAQKKKFNASEDLIFEFSEYVVENGIMSRYPLIELFPERYMIRWLEKYFPAYVLLFQTFLSAINQESSITDKKKAYQLLYKSFLKNMSSSTKPTIELSTAVVKDLLVLSDSFTEQLTKISTELSALQPKVLKEEEEKLAAAAEEAISIVLKDRQIENMLLQYFQFGILSWENRATGIEGIEKIIFELHSKQPQILKSIFLQIPLAVYPALLIRLDNTIDKKIAEIIFNNYFSKTAAKEQLESVRYRENIIRLFFEKGTVPWIEIINNNIPYVEEIILSFYRKDPDYFIRIIKEYKVESRPEFIKRIEEIFSPALLTLITSLLEKSSVLTPEQPIDALIELPSDADLIVYFLSYFEKHKKLPQNISFSLEELLDLFLTEFPEESRLYFTAAAYADFSILRQKITSDLKKRIDKLLDTDISKKEKVKTKPKNSTDEKPALKLIQEPVYISNAGLVLVHPFLQRFFSLSGLLEKRKFKDEAAAHKAVHLLQYLVNKGEKTEEHQLVLNKILCGIPLSEPIDRDIELTEEDKETCESLLQGVVENWPILKKTSNDNFRVSLLQREGRLTGDETSWRLKVEERGYDVLLDKLPWTISMIKLPWMEKVINVEWR
jgi:hypothetical protein